MFSSSRRSASGPREDACRLIVVRVVDQKTAVVPLHADTLADPNKLLASIRSLVDLA